MGSCRSNIWHCPEEQHHTEVCLCASSLLQTISPVSTGLRAAAMVGAAPALLVAASSPEAALGGPRAEETFEAAPVAPAA